MEDSPQRINERRAAVIIKFNELLKARSQQASDVELRVEQFGNRIQALKERKDLLEQVEDVEVKASCYSNIVSMGAAFNDMSLMVKTFETIFLQVVLEMVSTLNIPAAPAATKAILKTYRDALALVLGAAHPPAGTIVLTLVGFGRLIEGYLESQDNEKIKVTEKRVDAAEKLLALMEENVLKAIENGFNTVNDSVTRFVPLVDQVEAILLDGQIKTTQP